MGSRKADKHGPRSSSFFRFPDRTQSVGSCTPMSVKSLRSRRREKRSNARRQSAPHLVCSTLRESEREQAVTCDGGQKSRAQTSIPPRLLVVVPADFLPYSIARSRSRARE